jgi:hypothetical protein
MNGHTTPRYINIRENKTGQLCYDVEAYKWPGLALVNTHTLSTSTPISIQLQQSPGTRSHNNRDGLIEEKYKVQFIEKKFHPSTNYYKVKVCIYNSDTSR